MPVVTVLDFETGEVHIYEYSHNLEDVKDFISEQGHSVTNCQWLCTDKINLQIHSVGEAKKKVIKESIIPEKCELCEYIITSGTHATCYLTNNIIPDVSLRPNWCPLPLLF